MKVFSHSAHPPNQSPATSTSHCTIGLTLTITAPEGQVVCELQKCFLLPHLFSKANIYLSSSPHVLGSGDGLLFVFVSYNLTVSTRLALISEICLRLELKVCATMASEI